MKHFFLSLLLVLFAGVSVVLTSCSKDDPAPATTGTVTGQITPANSVTTVTATNTATNTTTTATPNASGAYTFSNLAPGTYTLSYTPATGFSAPAPQTVTVTAGTTTTATGTTATAGGSGSFTVGGTTTTPTLIQANLQFSTNLSITMASAARSVVMNIDGFRGTTGTFSLSAQSFTATQLIYSETVGTSAQQWTTADFLSGGRGTGSIVITAVTANPRRVSGTFTATAYPAMSTTTGSRTITGSFTNLPY